jgi:acyl-CoA synthetase (AMP-forming)/AMP-acid ligase II
MTSTSSVPTTLVGLLASIPADHTAIILPDLNIRVSYGELRRQVQDLAGALAASGIRRGDRVGMALPNSLSTVVAFLAASMAGTAAPLNPGQGRRVPVLPRGHQREGVALRVEGMDEARRPPDTPILTVDIATGARPRVSSSPCAPEIDDVALILHTSGSTGRPKRVPLSHANLTISAQNVARGYALTARDVSLCVMPLFHVHGLVASTLATLATGGAVVVPSKFSPLSFWRVAQEAGATWYSAVPTIHQLLLARVKAGDPRPAGAEKLRFIRSCSASLPPQVMHDLEAAFGAPVLEAYG